MTKYYISEAFTISDIPKVVANHVKYVTSLWMTTSLQQLTYFLTESGTNCHANFRAKT